MFQFQNGNKFYSVDDMKNHIVSAGKSGIGMTYRCWVTPDDAVRMLKDKNYIGSTPKPVMKRIIKDINEGQWNEYLGSVSVTPDFFREDGFNRLTAISMSDVEGVNVLFTVVPKETFLHHSADSGTPRSLRHTLVARGFDHTTEEASHLRAIAQCLGYPVAKDRIAECTQPFFESIIGDLRNAIGYAKEIKYGHSIPPKLVAQVRKISINAAVLSSIAGKNLTSPIEFMASVSTGDESGGRKPMLKQLHQDAESGVTLGRDADKKERTFMTLHLIEKASSKRSKSYFGRPSWLDKHCYKGDES